MSCHTYKSAPSYVWYQWYICIHTYFWIEIHTYTWKDLKLWNKKFWTQEILGKPSRRLRTPKEKRKNRIWSKIFGPRKWMSHVTRIYAVLHTCVKTRNETFWENTFISITKIREPLTCNTYKYSPSYLCDNCKQEILDTRNSGKTLLHRWRKIL